MSDLNDQLRRYIDGLAEPVSVDETMSRSRQRPYRVPVAVLAGAAIVLLPALVLIGLRWLPGDDNIAEPTTVPPIVTSTTTATLPETTTTTTAGAALVRVPDLVGLSEGRARDVLETLGLMLEVAQYRHSFDPVGVAAQEPEPSSAVAAGASVVVDIYVVPACPEYLFEIPSDSMLVTVLMQCGPSEFPNIVSPIPRVVPQSPNVIEATLNALLAGPTGDESADGYGSFFSAESATALNTVSLADSRLTVDFNDRILINNASTSTGGLFFMAELQANLFQFDEVESIEFQLDGSCDAFSNWLQSECQIMERTEWEQRIESWTDTSEIVTPPGEALPNDQIIGEFVTTREINGSRFLMLASAPLTAWTGFTETGGWMIEPGTFVLTVPGADGENLWLVTRQEERTPNGRTINQVEAIFELPWQEVWGVLQEDPILFGGAEVCTFDGLSESRLVVIAEIAAAEGAANPLRVWWIDIQHRSLVELTVEPAECFVESS